MHGQPTGAGALMARPASWWIHAAALCGTGVIAMGALVMVLLAFWAFALLLQGRLPAP